MKKTLSVIICVALVLSLMLCFSSCGGKNETGAASSKVSLENSPEVYAVALNVRINPNILLYIGDNGDIISCEFLNEDAEKMIDKRLIEGRLLEDAMTDIISEAVNQGYLKDGGDVELYVVKSNLGQVEMDEIVNVADEVVHREAKSKGIEVNINRHQADDAIATEPEDDGGETEPAQSEQAESKDAGASSQKSSQSVKNSSSHVQTNSNNQTSSKKQTSSSGGGTSSKKQEGCSVCWGSGKCGYCNAKGTITCEVCHGSGHESCSQCNGEGKMKCSCGNGKCSLCKGAKSITCETCKGNGDSSCPGCKGTHKQGCYRCESTGKCLQCNGTKYTGTCNKCGGKGYSNCGPCKGTGITACTQCHGSKKCPACNGTGKKPD